MVLGFVLLGGVFGGSSRRSTCRSWFRLGLVLVLAALGLGLGILVIPSATPSTAAGSCSCTCDCDCDCDCECNVNSAAMRSMRTPFVPDDWMPVARAMRCNCADFKHASQGCVGEYSAAERRIWGLVCACCLLGVAFGGAGSGLLVRGESQIPITAVLGWMHGHFWEMDSLRWMGADRCTDRRRSRLPWHWVGLSLIFVISKVLSEV